MQGAGNAAVLSQSFGLTSVGPACGELRVIAILGALLPAQAQEGSAPPDMWPWQSFKSSPATPPKFNITKTGPTAPGYLFITPNGVTKASAPFIMDESGDLIWQGPEGTQYNFEPQMLNNQPVISYWNGTFLPDGIGYGDVTRSV
ncbi:hypothetical protein KEM55_005091 [Ascosphaera atra]|nr:hypothetical protein KEM55_005091 [Ascosphaera atra]